MPILFSYSVGKILDRNLENLLTYKLIDLSIDGYYFYMDFENGYCLKAWDTNKWYAWMCRGSISRNGELIFEWCEDRPRRRTFRRFRRLYRKYSKSSVGRSRSKIETKLENKKEEIQKSWVDNLEEHKKFLEEFRQDNEA
jgi:hypothetical protein